MMRAMTGNEVRQAVRGRWLSRHDPVPVRGVSIDSRTAVQDDLFIAITGGRFDGHDFLDQAAEKGCVAAIVNLSKEPPAELMNRFPAGVIGVPDTREALLELGSYYRSVIPATVVGVTGSNGKTTVKRMIHHILSRRLTGTCSPKSYNNDIGVPLTLLSAGAGDDYVICEVGSNAPGEIARLARATKPNISVITCVSAAHLERLGSLDRIAVEKAALLGWLGERDIAVVNADSPQLDNALKSYEKRMIRFGQTESAQLRLTAYESDGRTQRFQINERDWVEMRVPGRHNAVNALAAIAVAVRFGFTQEEAAEALGNFCTSEMRLERIEAGDVELINDAYNANPASVQAAVSVLAECKARRRVVILGDMKELGEEAERIHAELGLKIAARKVDLVVGVGEMGKLAADQAGRAGKKTAAFDDADQAAGGIGELLRPGDLVLLKGSRSMHLEKLVPVICAARGGIEAATAPAGEDENP
jgi:UDP-N-acetylmuramoyl-tripeptide--D-alanyl-D-alanine ligase